MRFAKANGVTVGPGRGSAAGSIVAYALRITDLDPMRYDLLFERFLNPGRKTMPDIDIDFSVHGRERVIAYVTEKYGRERVAQIITFSKLAAKASVRDAGRVMGLPYGAVDRIAKLVPEGVKVGFEESLKPNQELRKAYDEDELVRQVVDMARPLEGLVRADSIHAAGVVIGDRPLVEYLPLQQKGADSELVTQYPMGDVEALGLLKMDFLGLRNLDVIDEAIRIIRESAGIDLGDLSGLPLDDQRTYDMLARGDTLGVFQFESSGMRDALRQVKPTEFEDLVALVALYRPGPMANIPVFARRKNGLEPVTYLDPRLEPILRTTQGVYIYQEQAMQIAKDLAGFTPAEADDLRKAISQEGARADGLAAREVPRGLRGQRRAARRRRIALGGERAQRRLLVQQGARRLLRDDRLPHGLPEGQPSRSRTWRRSSPRSCRPRTRCRSTSTPAARWASRCCRPTSTARARTSRSSRDASASA